MRTNWWLVIAAAAAVIGVVVLLTREAGPGGGVPTELEAPDEPRIIAPSGSADGQEIEPAYRFRPQETIRAQLNAVVRMRELPALTADGETPETANAESVERTSWYLTFRVEEAVKSAAVLVAQLDRLEQTVMPAGAEQPMQVFTSTSSPRGREQEQEAWRPPGAALLHIEWRFRLGARGRIRDLAPAGAGVSVPPAQRRAMKILLQALWPLLPPPMPAQSKCEMQVQTDWPLFGSPPLGPNGAEQRDSWTPARVLEERTISCPAELPAREEGNELVLTYRVDVPEQRLAPTLGVDLPPPPIGGAAGYPRLLITIQEYQSVGGPEDNQLRFGYDTLSGWRLRNATMKTAGEIVLSVDQSLVRRRIEVERESTMVYPTRVTP